MWRSWRTVYETEAEAAQAIAGITDFYKNSFPDVYNSRQADVEQAVAELQAIFDRTTFPFMNVTWECASQQHRAQGFPGLLPLS